MKLVAFLNLGWTLIGYYLFHYYDEYDIWIDTEWVLVFTCLTLPFIFFFLLHPNIRKFLNDQELATTIFGDLDRIQGDAVYNYTEEEKKRVFEFGGSTYNEGQPKDFNDRAGVYLWTINFIGFFIYAFLSYKVLKFGLLNADNNDLFVIGSCVLSLINFLSINFSWLSKPQQS